MDNKLHWTSNDCSERKCVYTVGNQLTENVVIKCIIIIENYDMHLLH